MDFAAPLEMGSIIVSSDGVILAQGSEFTFKEETLFELPA